MLWVTRRNGLLQFISVSMGTGDGPACLRCGPTAAPGYDSSEDILLRCARMLGPDSMASPGRSVLLLGPEPLKHPELPAVIAGVRSLGVERIAVRTDARGFAVGDNAAGAFAAGVRHVHVVFLGPDAATHDGLVGAPGAFRAAQAGLHAFGAAASRSGLPWALIGSVPLCRHTIVHLPETVAAFAAAGAVLVTADVVGTLDPERSRPWIDAGFQTGVVSGVWVHVAGWPAPVPTEWAKTVCRSPLTLEASREVT
jgi:MoaA/NifB/PqqE/SkfB family radical SAM enzyme